MCEHMSLQETSLDGVELTHSGQTSAADWYEEQERRMIDQVSPFSSLGNRETGNACLHVKEEKV